MIRLFCGLHCAVAIQSVYKLNLFSKLSIHWILSKSFNLLSKQKIAKMKLVLFFMLTLIVFAHCNPVEGNGLIQIEF